MTEFIRKALMLLQGKEPVGVILDPNVRENWTLDADFILDNTEKYSKERVGRFAYNPRTRELVWGTISEMHAIMIKNQSDSSFDDFVRGAYDGHTVYLRWYSADPYADPEEVKEQSFNAWYDTKQMLEANGLPPGMEVQMGVSTQDLKENIGPWYR